ncbi:coproporphyrinogen III oxidase [Caldalkalibacillus salinus]|uniref:coproporphyrinogen III oxidase n=1 Tax=Caldalkalibacillus salinus TaxID=2803787 RepID=UPI001F00C777|nr:coproporphyrinogen III oxidase [Caldalkalibacillus salinus]
MNIEVYGLPEHLHRPMELLTQLFYESPTLQFYTAESGDQHDNPHHEKRVDLENDNHDNQKPHNSDGEHTLKGDTENTLKIEVNFEREVEPDNDSVTVRSHVKLEDLQSGQHVENTFEASFPSFATEKDQKRAYKHCLNHNVLDVLQSFTGVIQPWGILTGIRPTKLLHNMLQEGQPLEKAHDSLRQRYRIQDDKINLMQNIVDRQLEVVPDLHDLNREVSIYIGIPFCPTKCAYCTFPAYSIQGQQGSVGAFLEGLHYEIKHTGQWLRDHGIGITTVYFGGGTPTSIEAEQMDALYEEMYRSLPGMEQVRELTVEAGRPDTITPEKIDVLKKHHIDRISINPQSYTEDTLQAIGRHHSVEETIEKYKMAKARGLNNINMDLIIGLPGEGVKELEHSLEETAKLRPESLTVHTLSFKRASAMTKNREKYQVANRDEIVQMMQLASDWTQAQGYHPYYLYRQKNILGNLENVGYALQGKDSIYNIMIMEEKQTIIGLGCGASSKWVHPVTGKITRFANPKEPRAYNEGYQDYTQKKLEILEALYAKHHTVDIK